MTTKAMFKRADAKGGVLDEVEGVVCWLMIDGKRHKFMLVGGALNDWRSGARVGDYTTKQALHYAANPYRKRLTDKDAAQALLSEITMRHGFDKLRNVLAKPPTLNG